MRLGAACCGVVAAIFVVIPMALAQDSPPSDDVVMLPCDGRCPSVTQPVRQSGTVARFPTQFTWGDYVEALVELEYTIGTDGRVSDVHVKHVLGPETFANLAKRSLDDWVYKPATLNGEPVAISHQLRYYFSIPNADGGARSTVVRAYERAVALINDKKLDEAFDVLNSAAQQPKLNFYERGMLASLTAPIMAIRGNAAGAQNVSGMAIFYGERVLSPAVLRNLHHVHIQSSLALGDIVEAAKSLGRLTRVRGFDPADPIVTAVSDMRKKLDATPSYSVPARIPDVGEADGYSFWLYRRYFSFTNIVGKLDRVTVDCRERQVVSPIKENVDWHVPPTWSDCSLFIRGTPGTTFNIVQISPDKPAAP